MYPVVALISPVRIALLAVNSPALVMDTAGVSPSVPAEKTLDPVPSSTLKFVETSITPVITIFLSVELRTNCSDLSFIVVEFTTHPPINAA